MSNPMNMVPFLLAGEGAYLRFRTIDLVKLRETHGKPEVVEVDNPATGFPEKVWQTFTERFERLVMLQDPIAIVEGLKVGLKQADGRTPFSGIDFNDLPFGLTEVVEPMRDALTLAITNKPYAALLAERRAQQEAGKEQGPLEDGPTTDETSSTGSWLSDMAQAS